MARACLLLLLIPLGAAAQQVELSGGLSSLYQAAGGQLSLRAENLQASVGAGLLAGRPVAGAHLDLHRGSAAYSAGILEQPLNLPTDLFDNAHRLLGLGAGLATASHGSDIRAFLGLTSARFDTPLFQAATPQSPVALLQTRTPLAADLQLHTQLILGTSLTALTSLAWHPRRSLNLALTSGTGNHSHYAAASLDYAGPRLQLKSTYSSLGQTFIRIGSDPTLLPEPIRENISFTFRPQPESAFSLSGSRQNFLIAASPSAPAARSSVDQLASNLTVRGTALSASLFRSSYAQDQTVALALAASRSLGRRLQTGLNLYQNWTSSNLNNTAIPGTRLLVANVEETLTNRIAINQNITRSTTSHNSQLSVNFGGSLLTSFATLSAAWQTFYVPTQPAQPFQQSLILDLQFNLFGRIFLHGGTFVSPLGKLLYTAEAHASAVHAPPAAPSTFHTRLGSAILRGRVLTSDSIPVPGAPIELDGNLLYTDSDGQFFLREPRPTTHALHIPTDQFLDGRTYKVLAAPALLASNRPPLAPTASIIVQLVEPDPQPK